MRIEWARLADADGHVDRVPEENERPGPRTSPSEEPAGTAGKGEPDDGYLPL